MSFVLDRIGLSIGNDVVIDDVSLSLEEGSAKVARRADEGRRSTDEPHPSPIPRRAGEGVFERGASPWRRGRSADISMEETRGRP